MKQMLLAAVAVTLVAAASPVLAGPSEDAAWDLDGWKAAREANPTPPAETRHGHVIYQTNPTGR